MPTADDDDDEKERCLPFNVIQTAFCWFAKKGGNPFQCIEEEEVEGEKSVVKYRDVVDVEGNLRPARDV